MPDDMLLPVEHPPALTRAQAVQAFQKWLEENEDAEWAEFRCTILQGQGTSQVQVQTRARMTFASYVGEVPTPDENEETPT